MQLLAALLAVVLLGGCAAAGAIDAPIVVGTSNGYDDDADPIEAVPNAADEQTPNNEAQPEQSFGPLEEFQRRIQGVNWWDTALSPQEAVELGNQYDRARGEFMANCMAQFGFEHLPRSEFSTHVIAPARRGPVIPPGSREWAQRFGFGMSTQMLYDFGVNSWTPGPTTMEWDDEKSAANHERIRAKSIPERTAYHEALWGIFLIEFSVNPVTDWQHITFMSDPTLLPELREDVVGCEPLWMFDQLQVQDPPDEFASLREEVFENFAATIANNPATAAINAEWGSCMIDSGVEPPSSTWSTPQLMQTAMWEHWAPISGFEQFFQALPEWDWDTYPDGPPPALDPTDFRQWERAMAVADWDCREKVDLEQRLRDINLAMQQQFVDRHGAELEAWALHVEERRSGSQS